MYKFERVWVRWAQRLASKLGGVSAGRTNARSRGVAQGGVGYRVEGGGGGVEVLQLEVRAERIDAPAPPTIAAISAAVMSDHSVKR